MRIEPHGIELPVIEVRDSIDPVVMAVHRICKDDHIVPDDLRTPCVVADHDDPMPAPVNPFHHRRDTVFEHRFRTLKHMVELDPTITMQQARLDLIMFM